MPLFDELKIFTGNAHPALAQAICDYLGIPLGTARVFKFSNDNTFVQFLDDLRHRDVFLIQPFAYPVNDSVMELLIMADAARRASAGRVTAVVPYYAYGRTDKKDQPRVPITARLIADCLQVAGVNRILTIDLHAGQIQGFFNIPVDELSALPLLARHIQQKRLGDAVVVAVDIGISKKSRDMAARLGLPLAIIEKRRLGNQDRTETLTVIGDVEGKATVCFDDEIDTAGSLMGALQALEMAGAREVYACCTHPVFSGPAVQRINTSPLKEVAVTDTLPLPPSKASPKVTVLSIAPLLGEAIHRIHAGLSVSRIFEE